MKNNRITKEIREFRIYRKNRKGRLRMKWEDQVRQTAEKREIQWSDKKIITQNRTFGRQTLENNL